jgi:tRNA (guanine26-N2/guanine27-N2)-dimethyltransferase
MEFPASEETAVFYNPVQVQNRDLSVLMIALHAERVGRPLHILDALAASGLRSIRYWKELNPEPHSHLSYVAHITVNDLDRAATERAQHNIQLNDVPTATDRSQPGIRVRTGDATTLLYQSRTSYGGRNKPAASRVELPSSAASMEEMQWDVIDLDPYGSATPFLDAAIQAVRHGGMLNVTCTDMVALGGAHPETCFGRYVFVFLQQ